MFVIKSLLYNFILCVSINLKQNKTKKIFLNFLSILAKKKSSYFNERSVEKSRNLKDLFFVSLARAETGFFFFSFFYNSTTIFFFIWEQFSFYEWVCEFSSHSISCVVTVCVSFSLLKLFFFFFFFYVCVSV